MKQIIILFLLLASCSPMKLQDPPRKVKPVIKSMSTYATAYYDEVLAQGGQVLDTNEILYNGQVFCPSLKCD